MSVYLGYDEITKQYLKSLTGGSASSASSSSPNTNGFTMSGDIDMGGNEVTGLDDPSSDGSAANKKYVDDEISKISVSGGLDQATADGRYLQKTDASSTYETQSDTSNTYLSKTDATNTYVKDSVFQATLRSYSDSTIIDRDFLRKTDASNTYLSKTDAATTYAPVDASYTKSQSDNKYSLKGSGGGGGGLSSSGFTMTGDIDMGDNKILKLLDPTAPKEAANKKYVDNNFLGKRGGLILGNIDMSGQSITNLNLTPQSNNEAVTKKYVDDSIGLAGGFSITGITMQGDIDMSGHDVTGLADPTSDDMAARKGYVDGNFLDLAGGTMTGDINMGGYEVYGVTSVPSFNNALVNKKYVDDSISALGSGITQVQADARYLRISNYEYDNWMDEFDDMNFVDYNWSKHVRKSSLGSLSNIEIRVASFITSMSISQLLKHKLMIGIRYVDSSTITKHLITVTLSGKSFSKLSYGASGSSGDNGHMYSFHIHEEEFVGGDADATDALLWQVGAKFEATKSHTLLDTRAYVSFALNFNGL